MGITKQKLRNDEPALGAWVMINHPASAELMAGAGFDWIAVDMEHTGIDLPGLENIARAVNGTGVDLIVRLPACDPDFTKRVLDIGAEGIIVPNVNTPELARRAAEMARYPPEGMRGTSLVRAAGYGRNFADYVRHHNENVLVAVMIEHIDAVENIDAILSTPGVDATFIGPYDLSASMGIPGQIDRPEVREAQSRVLEACRRHRVPPGMHVVPVDPQQIRERIDAGFRFIACSIDTQIIMDGCRRLLGPVRGGGD